MSRDTSLEAFEGAPAGKPSLLYISPVCPSTTGSGTPMRAGIVLEALAEYYRISLLVSPTPIYGGFEHQLPPALARLCEHIEIVKAAEDRKQWLQRAAEIYQGRSFETVHVFRLDAIPVAQSYLKRGIRKHFDLDDVESQTHRRLARLHRESGNEAMAGEEEEQAKRLALLEAVSFRMFDRVYVCSEVDRQQLLNRSCRAEVSVLRNAVRLPAADSSREQGRPDGVFRFLFVGTLGYYPNEDGIRYFCDRILPLIRAQTRRPFLVDVVGRGGSHIFRDLTWPNVNMVGAVASVGTHYRASDAVIVPLRAGGGTRIKILEAFSYARPVITTSIGIEGIDAVANRHVLVADTPESFAAGCLEIMNDAGVGSELVENASVLLHESYTLKELKVALKPAKTF